MTAEMRNRMDGLSVEYNGTLFEVIQKARKEIRVRMVYYADVHEEHDKAVMLEMLDDLEANLTLLREKMESSSQPLTDGV